MLAGPLWQTKPEIVQAGIARHGHASAETYCHREAWSLHFYQYHGKIRWSGGEREVVPDLLSLVPPDLPVEWSFPREASHYYVHFLHPAKPEIQEVWTRMDPGWALGEMEEIRLLHVNEPLQAEVGLWHVLNRLSRSTVESSPAAASGALGIAISLLRNHLDETLRIRELASRSGVSTSHLNRLFREEFGHSAQEHLQQTRQEVACRLLRYSRLPVRVIAARVGIPDPQAFNKFFRKRTGMSPTAYREEGE